MVALRSFPTRSSNSLLGERVLARQAELEARLMELDAGSAEYTAIDTALATLDQYLGADLDHLSPAIAHNLNGWLERNKYLARSARSKNGVWAGSNASTSRSSRR